MMILLGMALSADELDAATAKRFPTIAGGSVGFQIGSKPAVPVMMRVDFPRSADRQTASAWKQFQACREQKDHRNVEIVARCGPDGRVRFTGKRSGAQQRSGRKMQGAIIRQSADNKVRGGGRASRPTGAFGKRRTGNASGTKVPGRTASA
jgi:hypothetical protein